MTPDNPIPFGPGQGERPTWRAELRINSEQVQAGTITRRWGTAEGMVPTDQVNHLVTTFGIAATIVTGTSGAVVTLRLSRGLTVIALAELALALTGAALIALCSRAHRHRPAGQSQDDPDRPAGQGRKQHHDPALLGPGAPR